MKDVLFYPSVCLPLVTTTKMPPFCFSNIFWRVAVSKEEHKESTLQLIMVLLGNIVDTNGHPQNAHSSMVVMLFRKAIEVKEQSEDIHPLIVVIPSLITTFLICFLFEEITSIELCFIISTVFFVE